MKIQNSLAKSTQKLFAAFICAALVVANVCNLAAQAQKAKFPRKVNMKNAVQKNSPESIWVEQTLRSLSLRERIGQMIVVGALGEYKNVASEKFADIKKQIVENKVGGFVFYRGDVLELAAMTNEMQRVSKIPLLMAADFERGLPMQIKSGTSFTHNMGIAAAGNPNDSYQKGQIIAEEMRAIGINWLYGPVSDVLNNPANSMVNVRSYGENPQTVSRFVEAEVRGLRDGGVLSTAKHFPGHGDTPIDSHINTPTINISRERFETVELAPFRAAIAAGLDSFMTAHIALPEITGDNVPASLSPQINRDLIRKELKFDGIITTDSLGMGAIVKNYKGVEGAVRAIKAGADIALLPPDPKGTIDAIEQAVLRGEIPKKQIDDSVRRILRAKYRVGLATKKSVDLAKVNKIVEKPENVKFANELAERSMTLFRNENNVLPLGTKQANNTLFIVVAGDDDPDQGKVFQTAIETRLKNARVMRVDKRTTEKEYEQILTEAGKAGTILIAPFVKRAALKGTIALPETEADFVRKLIDKNKSVAVVAFGSPYQLQQFPEAKVYLAAWAVEDVAQNAAARAIFGETAITGHSPVGLPNFFKIGDGMQLSATKRKEKDAKEATEIFN
ncbi:MAG: glycoside hydrolase family 3 C-terminal domain-containing protein [Acidobacteria bacterium]|jgi:beta-N-acetylhexosaminidase|nr:glycoside hydrolase family 3 C-terminal domain-containing protein [Acidobacteriota bacterium]